MPRPRRSSVLRSIGSTYAAHHAASRDDGEIRAATYADKISRARSPEIFQSTKLVLVVNLKTAKAIGITIPQSVLFRADKVIE